MAVTYYVALPFVKTEEGWRQARRKRCLTNRLRSGGPSRCREIRPMPAHLRSSQR
jgi:hypothetical protein